MQVEIADTDRFRKKDAWKEKQAAYVDWAHRQIKKGRTKGKTKQQNRLALSPDLAFSDARNLNLLKIYQASRAD